MDKNDMLFLEKDCPECGLIRAALDIGAASDDSFVGKDGQGLMVFASMSNDASVEMLKRFGLEGRKIPVLVTHDGKVMEDSKQILWWLRQQKAAN